MLSKLFLVGRGVRIRELLRKRVIFTMGENHSLLSPRTKKMITENLIRLSCSSLLILLVFLQTSHANQMINPRDCSTYSSACGIIPNISSPFRLKNDPKHCGYPDYELSCENNVTYIYLNHQKYNVKAIDYENFTIWLADVSININNTCSFPKYSLYNHNLLDHINNRTRRNLFYFDVAAQPINFMSCPYPLKNSSHFIGTTGCTNKGGNVSGNGTTHAYIKVGHMNASDVNYMCSVDLIATTSWKFKDANNVSLSDIHTSLMYGFELSWSGFQCSQCRLCYQKEDGTVGCGSERIPVPPFLIVVLMIVLLVAGVSIPAKIVVGFTSIFMFVVIFGWDRSYSFSFDGLGWYDLLLIAEMIGYIHAAKTIIVFPCVLGLLIYMFRRRHLSKFDVIEHFLRSDNKLIPIRYSYSDIKKMTRGFREKLGQGGYGSVYKGKLRSGHYVAVKLLEKSKANGQDFINEIATIGRIHHVNVVSLVGYCAERSKRALVYDFMPNGSLEKYIFSKEEVNSLNWKRKFEIAVGVARGIEYLHCGCNIQILHFDIKPHNILLDDKFVPKISDFGLAKFFSPEKKTVTLTAARGTIGYVAPELINRGIGRVSFKADVYSFGMMLMDLVGLKREMIGNDGTHSQYFPYWIYDCFDKGKDIEFGKADKSDKDSDDSRRDIAKKMTIVALWCIRMNPDERPSMNKVLEMLEGGVDRLQIPNRLSESAPRVATNEDQSWSITSTESVSLLCHDAAHNVEITVEEACS